MDLGLSRSPATVELERILVGIAQEIEPEVLGDLAVDPELRVDRGIGRYLTEGLLVQLRGSVLAEKLVEREVEVTFERDVVFDFPSSPWQHLKERFAPAWLLRRFPVKTSPHLRHVTGTRTASFAQFATFPCTPLRTPEHIRGRLVVPYERVGISPVEIFNERGD